MLAMGRKGMMLTNIRQIITAGPRSGQCTANVPTDRKADTDRMTETDRMTDTDRMTY